MARPDLPGYLDVMDRLARARTRDDLEALIPEVCSLAGGIYRQELATLWFKKWKYHFPDVPIRLDLWPPVP